MSSSALTTMRAVLFGQAGGAPMVMRNCAYSFVVVLGPRGRPSGCRACAGGSSRTEGHPSQPWTAFFPIDDRLKTHDPRHGAGITSMIGRVECGGKNGQRSRRQHHIEGGVRKGRRGKGAKDEGRRWGSQLPASEPYDARRFVRMGFRRGSSVQTCALIAERSTGKRWTGDLRRFTPRGGGPGRRGAPPFCPAPKLIASENKPPVIPRRTRGTLGRSGWFRTMVASSGQASCLLLFGPSPLRPSPFRPSPPHPLARLTNVMRTRLTNGKSRARCGARRTLAGHVETSTRLLPKLMTVTKHYGATVALQQLSFFRRSRPSSSRSLGAKRRREGRRAVRLLPRNWPKPEQAGLARVFR